MGRRQPGQRGPRHHLHAAGHEGPPGHRAAVGRGRLRRFLAHVDEGLGLRGQLRGIADRGKLRPEQLIAQLKKNPNPVCIFNAQAHIGAFVRLVVSTPLADIDFPIADTTILDEPDLTAFCNTQQVEPPPPDPATGIQLR